MTRILAVIVLLLAATLAGRAQDPPASQPAASAPTSQPAASQPAVNPFRSPYSMVGFFLGNVDPETSDEEIDPAVFDCLDQAAVDPERWKQNKFEYARQLAEILGELEGRGLFDPEELPTDPATEPAPIIGNADLALTLQRVRVDGGGEEGADRFNWVFTAATVGRLPELHAKLAELDQAGETPEAPTPSAVPREDLDRLLSPAQMLSYFLNQQAAAETDTTAYRKAMACIDFGGLLEDRNADGPRYVDDLARVLTFLIDNEALKIDDVQAAEGKRLATINSSSFRALQIELAEQPDGAWVFTTETVRGIRQWASEVGDLTSIPNDTSSPRATLNLFFQAMVRQELDEAIRCFDTRGLDNADPSVLHDLAGKLWLVLNRHKLYVMATVPKQVEGKRFELLTHAVGRIELLRSVDKEGTERWLFPPTTIRDIDSLYAAYASKPILPELDGQRISPWALPSLYIREYLVPPSYKHDWNGLQIWQWLGLGFTALASALAYLLSARLIPPLVRRVLSTRDAVILPTTVRRSLRPLFYLALIGTLTLGLRLLDLGAETMSWVLWTLRMVATIVAVWAAYQVIDLGTAFFSVIASGTRSRLDDVLVPLVQKTLKVVAAALGGIVIANAFGANVGPLLAGLGVGGLAFGLAAQDTLKNFFGSVNVVLDRPFQVGDWVRVGDTEGTIEAVGLRSTRIRTFYNSEITVPNSSLMTTAIDNMGRRRYRRISTQLGVLYSTTPEQLDAFCEGIRELIRQHPYTRKDYFHVYVNQFSASSIDILLYCFHECPDWSVELRERHRLLLDIMRLAKRLGVEFAYPTQTLHLHHDSSPDTPPPETPPVPTERSAAEVFGRDAAAGITTEFPPAADELPK